MTPRPDITRHYARQPRKFTLISEMSNADLIDEAVIMSAAMRCVEIRDFWLSLSAVEADLIRLLLITWPDRELEDALCADMMDEHDRQSEIHFARCGF